MILLQLSPLMLRLTKRLSKPVIFLLRIVLKIVFHIVALAIGWCVYMYFDENFHFLGMLNLFPILLVYALFAGIFGTILNHTYKKIIKNAVESIPSVKSFSKKGDWEMTNFYRDVLDLGTDFSITKHHHSEDIISMALNDTEVTIGEIEVSRYSRYYTNKLYSGMGVIVNMPVKYADKVIISCTEKAMKLPFRTTAGSYNVYADTLEDYQKSDIRFIRQMADKITDYTENTPFAMLFFNGKIYFLIELYDISSYDIGMFSIDLLEHFKKDMERTHYRMELAGILSEKYTKTQCNQ